MYQASLHSGSGTGDNAFELSSRGIIKEMDITEVLRNDVAKSFLTAV